MGHIRNKFLVFAMALAILAPACSSSGNGSGGGINFTNPTTDLVVGDNGNNQVALYLDVLAFNATSATAFPTPDVILDGTGSGIVRPRSLILTSRDLVVCDGATDTGTYTVRIFRDYLNLTDAQAPDVIFDSSFSTPINGPASCAFDATDDILAVANYNSDTVLLISDLSTLPAGTNPVATTVTLDNATSLINNPLGVFISGDATTSGNRDLYVANNANSGAGQACVTIYRNVGSLANAAAPSVHLDADVSFNITSSTSGSQCGKVSVFNDVLYVSTKTNDEVFVFEGASTLTNNALPDAVLSGAGSDLQTTMDAFVSSDLSGNSILWVPSRDCSPSNAISAFFIPNGGHLIDGQQADLVLNSEARIGGGAQMVRVAGGGLFFQAQDNGCEADNVFIYKNASAIQNKVADIIIPGSDGNGSLLRDPKAIDARARDLGT